MPVPQYDVIAIPSGGTAVDVDEGGVIDFVFPAGIYFRFLLRK